MDVAEAQMSHGDPYLRSTSLTRTTASIASSHTCVDPTDLPAMIPAGKESSQLNPGTNASRNDRRPFGGAENGDIADEASGRWKEEGSGDFTDDETDFKPSAPSSPTFPPYEKLAQKKPSPWDHLSITLGGPMILLFDIIVPCIIYYVWFNIHNRQWKEECASYTNHGESCPIAQPEYNNDILGYAIISFGFGELYILLARVCRLLYHPEECAPLLSRSKWELDATCWVYLVAMLMAFIPFVVGSTLEIPKLYLYSPAFLMGFLGLLMLASLLSFPIPIGINSQARGTPMRPFIYYAAEDFIAVDGLQDREFRIRYNARYDSSAAFRRLFVELTVWWIFGVLVYIGCVSAVIWTLPFHTAFGLSLGVLFSYIAVWAAVSYLWVQFSMERQRKKHESAEV